MNARIETTDAPAAVQLMPDRAMIHADGEDLAIITVTVLDAKRRDVPDPDNLIRFSIEGNGAIIGVGNWNPSSHEADKFRADGLKDASIMINAIAAQPRPFVPE